MDVISRILRPFRNRRRQINWVEVADVQGSFYHATESLADVHRFFADEKIYPKQWLLMWEASRAYVLFADRNPRFRFSATR